MSNAPSLSFISSFPPNPRREDDETSESGVFRRRPRSASHARILLADPDAILRRAVAEALRDRSYEVIEASTPREAEAHVLDGLDLVVTSFEISMGGVEVLPLEKPVSIAEVVSSVLAALIEVVMVDSVDSVREPGSLEPWGSKPGVPH